MPLPSYLLLCSFEKQAIDGLHQLSLRVLPELDESLSDELLESDELLSSESESLLSSESESLLSSESESLLSSEELSISAAACCWAAKIFGSS